MSPDHSAGVELLLAGFPCQDVSIVGGQRGLAGGRTPLVRHVFRLAEVIRAKRMLLENVQSMRFVHQGKVLNYLVSECERLGYAWAYRILDSRGFNLAQRRRRLYFLASRIHDPGVDLLCDSGSPIPKEELSLEAPLGFYWTESRTGHGLTYDATPPIKAGSAVGIPSPPAVLLLSGEVVLPSLDTIERLQGFEANWTVAAPTRSRAGAPVLAMVRSRRNVGDDAAVLPGTTARASILAIREPGNRANHEEGLERAHHHGDVRPDLGRLRGVANIGEIERLATFVEPSDVRFVLRVPDSEVYLATATVVAAVLITGNRRVSTRSRSGSVHVLSPRGLLDRAA